jgi:hypothetical protein
MPRQGADWSFQAYSPVTLRRNGTDRQVFLDNIGKEVWVRGCLAKNGTPNAAAAGTLKFRMACCARSASSRLSGERAAPALAAARA